MGLLGSGALDPFPNAQLVVDGHVAIDVADVPVPTAGTPLPVHELAWRTGFSPGQPIVAVVEGLDASALPSDRAPTPGSGGVLLVDLDDGRFLGVMAELDAFPGADPQALLIRPLEALVIGHRIAVVVTTDAAPRPERFDDLIDHRAPSSLADQADHYRDLVADLETLGVDRDAIALAWDFPVGDGGVPLRSALAQLDPPGTWTLDEVREVGGTAHVPPLTFRVVEGTYTVQDFLTDDLRLAVGADGSVAPTGTAEAAVYVHIPASVADAPAGTVPVVLFGHGIFSAPDDYLDQDDDPSKMLELADESGFIVVACVWRGLTTSDLAGAIAAANDFGKLPVVPDRLVQAQINARTLAELLTHGDLLDAPAFLGQSGQSLPERDRLLYMGISLGGIQGSVFLAQDPPIEAGVLHVPGAMWSTMLERSSNWPLFEDLLSDKVTSSLDRQRLYAMSQLWWDPADPIAYAHLGPRLPTLVQESIGDQQVPNMVTRVLARTLGLAVLSPEVEVPWGIGSVTGPLPAGSSAYVQFDPQVGLPPDVNRPAGDSGAHEAPRTWEGTHQQIRDFFERGAEGTVRHWCGSDACAADNPG